MELVSVGVRSGPPDADSRLRDHLLASAVDFRQLMSTTLEGFTIEGGQSVWDHLSGRVDALLEGKEVTFSRHELPDWHDEAPCHGGDPSDSFTLGPDDVLREATTSTEPRFVPPNRAQRRAMGWRGETNGGPVR
jgi:hypothetical protein